MERALDNIRELLLILLVMKCYDYSYVENGLVFKDVYWNTLRNS